MFNWHNLFTNTSYYIRSCQSNLSVLLPKQSSFRFYIVFITHSLLLHLLLVMKLQRRPSVYILFVNHTAPTLIRPAPMANLTHVLLHTSCSLCLSSDIPACCSYYCGLPHFVFFLCFLIFCTSAFISILTAPRRIASLRLLAVKS